MSTVRRPRGRPLLILTAALGLVLLAGCGAKTVAETATGVQVDQEGDTTTITTDEGQTTYSADGNNVTITNDKGETLTMTTEEGKVPDGFPLPVLPGSKVTTGMRADSNGKISYTVEFQMSGDIQEAAAVYEKELKDRGLTVSRTDVSDDTQVTVMLMADSEKESGWVSFTGEKGSRDFTIGVLLGDK